MSERLIDAGGARLWVAEQGEGYPLMLASGGPGCCDYLEPVAAMLDDLVRVYRFEARGCGRSSPDGPYDLATTLSDLDKLRIALGHDRWLIGGHSWGADLALMYGLAYPQHTRAVLYLSGTGVQNDRQWHAAYEEGRDAGREINPVFAYPPNMVVNRTGVDSWRRRIQEPGLLRQLADAPAPLLAVAGSEDIRPDWPVRQVVALLPHARFESIAGAQHCQWLTHPSERQRLMREYVQERLAGC